MTNGRLQRLQLPEMDRREPASFEAAGRQQEGVRGRRDDRAGGRRAEPAYRFSRRPGGEIVLPAQGRHGAQSLPTTANSTTCRSARAKCSCCRRIRRIRRSARRRARSGWWSRRRAPPARSTASNWYCFECGALVHRIEVKVPASGEGPAAALRTVLRRRGRAQVQELRRRASRQVAAGGMGDAVVLLCHKCGAC